MKQWVRVAAVALLAFGLVLAFAVDVDGDPLTQDFPDIVLTAAPANENATDCEGRDGDWEQQRVRRQTARVLVLHRRSHRWTAILRRWHRSFLTDTPI